MSEILEGRLVSEGCDNRESVCLLKVKNLAKSYGDKVIFENVSFSLSPGSSLWVEGPSGCGKTTLLRCIALLEDVEAGEILFKGESILKRGVRIPPKQAVRLGIAMVFQQLFLWDHLTVIENVALPLRLRLSISKKESESMASESLCSLGILEKAYEHPVDLSGGQRQRVALSRALVHAPELLLLDEITANLDEETAAQVFSAVEAVNLRGTAVVLVSHSKNVPSLLSRSRLSCDQHGKWRYFGRGH